MAPGTVRVFGSPTSPEVARVLMCLFEKDVEFQLIRVDAYRGTKRMPQYLKLQPRGEALTFEDESVTLVESRRILRHISDKYAKQGNPDLIGTGALERSSIEQWLQTEAQNFDPPSSDLVFSLAHLPPSVPPMNGKDYVRQAKEAAEHAEMLALFEKSKKDLEKVLDIYENRLEEMDYLAGDNFTIADLLHVPNADRIAGDPRSGKMFERRHNVKRWWDRISARESWKYVKNVLQRPPPNEAPF